MIIIFIFLLVIFASYLSYLKAFYSSPKRKENIYNIPDTPEYSYAKPVMIRLIDEFEKVPFERVSITSFDGLTLYGRYYHVSDSAPLQIQFHGYRGTASRDFCGINKLGRNLGHNTLVVDQRAHGKSEGKTICFGIKEKYDCLYWVNYAIKRFGDIPIVLSGVSMGAATVVMASELDLPKNVHCIVADCPFSSPEEIIASECKKNGIPPIIGMPLIKLGALLFGNLKLSGSAAEAVKKSKIPVLIFHGEEDGFVPCYMGQKIKDSNPNLVTLETFPDADHGLSYIKDPKRYEAVTKEFFEKYI